MDRLISMTEFVLLQNKPGLTYLTAMDVCIKYANFLKKPLTLGMFVPVDNQGYVLEEPENLEEKLNASEYFTKEEVIEAHSFIESFTKAKERVLFDVSEFELVELEMSKKNYHELAFDNFAHTIKYYSGNFFGSGDSGDYPINTIEDLSKLNLTLTETAKKQIYGT